MPSPQHTMRRARIGLTLALTLTAGLTGIAQPVNGKGFIVVGAALLLLPDATRTPLTTLAIGTEVKVLSKEGEWYKVTYRDAYLGERTGYIRASTVRIEATATLPEPAAVTPTAPAVPARQQSVQSPPLPRTATVRQSSSRAERGYVSVSGTFQTTSNVFTAATAFTQNVEVGGLTTTYGVAHSPGLDVAGAARVWRNLAVGSAVTWLSKARDGDLSATVPHPFLFNVPRTVSGVVSDVERQELALHMNASWMVQAGRVTQIAIFGGPTYFQLTQGLVTDVGVSSVYPYDSASFIGATTVQAKRSQLGYNGGVDVTTRFAKYVGVGAIVRYSRADVRFPMGSGPDVTVRAGGLQVGGGLRLRF